MIRSFVSIVVATLVALAMLPALGTPQKLARGDAFPMLAAESIAGTHVSLPRDARGSAFIVIFGFSRKGGDASALWSHELFKIVPPTVEIYAAADLSRVPGLFRGLAISGVRRTASPARPEHRGRVLLLTARNDWSQMVPNGSDDDAAIVAVDRNGTIVDLERGPFSADSARAVAGVFHEPG